MYVLYCIPGHPTCQRTMALVMDPRANLSELVRVEDLNQIPVIERAAWMNQPLILVHVVERIPIYNPNLIYDTLYQLATKRTPTAAAGVPFGRSPHPQAQAQAPPQQSPQASMPPQTRTMLHAPVAAPGTVPMPPVLAPLQDATMVRTGAGSYRDTSLFSSQVSSDEKRPLGSLAASDIAREGQRVSVGPAGEDSGKFRGYNDTKYTYDESTTLADRLAKHQALRDNTDSIYKNQHLLAQVTMERRSIDVSPLGDGWVVTM